MWTKITPKRNRVDDAMGGRATRRAARYKYETSQIGRKDRLAPCQRANLQLEMWLNADRRTARELSPADRAMALKLSRMCAKLGWY